MRCKAVETTPNINKAFGPRTAIEMYRAVVVQEVLQREKRRALKVRSTAASHLKFTMTIWEQSSRLILLQLHEKLPKNSTATVLQLFGIWSELKRLKSLVSQYLMLLLLLLLSQFSRVRLCDSIDGSPPGSPVPGILQARTLEWDAVAFSNAWVKSESEVAQSCPTLHNRKDCSPPGSSVHGIFQARVLEWGAITFSQYLMSGPQIKHLSPWSVAFSCSVQQWTSSR